MSGHLQVFIDVDRLYAGQFDSSLLMNIKAAKTFTLVLSPGALDRCIGDDTCEDWIHKEVRSFFLRHSGTFALFMPLLPDKMCLGEWKKHNPHIDAKLCLAR